VVALRQWPLSRQLHLLADVGQRFQILSVTTKSPLSAEEQDEQPTHHEKEKEVNHDLRGRGIICFLTIGADERSKPRHKEICHPGA
jgi:hypothetical protein